MNAGVSGGDVDPPGGVEHAARGVGIDVDVDRAQIVDCGDRDGIGMWVVHVDVCVSVFVPPISRINLARETGHGSPVGAVPQFRRLQCVSVGRDATPAPTGHHLHLDGIVGRDDVATVHPTATSAVVCTLHEVGVSGGQRSDLRAVVVHDRIVLPGHYLQAGVVVVVGQSGAVEVQVLPDYGHVFFAPVRCLGHFPRTGEDRAWDVRVRQPYYRCLLAEDGNAIPAVVVQLGSDQRWVDVALEDLRHACIQYTYLGCSAGVQRFGVVAVLPVVVVDGRVVGAGGDEGGGSQGRLRRGTGVALALL